MKKLIILAMFLVGCDDARTITDLQRANEWKDMDLSACKKDLRDTNAQLMNLMSSRSIPTYTPSTVYYGAGCDQETILKYKCADQFQHVDGKLYKRIK